MAKDKIQHQSSNDQNKTQIPVDDGKQNGSSVDKSKAGNPQSRDRSGFDIFIKNQLLPDASSLFTYRPRPLAEIKDECFVTVDTNTLLLPYTVSKHSLDEIRKVFELLIEDKRFFIPGQVAREFVSNRASKQLDLLEAWHNINSNIPRFSETPEYKLLDSLDEYKEFKKLQGELRDLRKKYQNSVNKIIERIRTWNMDDPISELYRSLFDGNIVVDLVWDENSVIQEIDRRNLHDIPPGYGDRKKIDKGIGDFLIWKTILQQGKAGSSVIFVSQDEKKGDWVYIRGENRLYARYELLDEFRRESNGQSFHNIRLADLLELYGATNAAVEEVRQSEQTENARIVTKSSETGESPIELSKLTEIMLIEQDNIINTFAILSFYLKDLVFDTAHGSISKKQKIAKIKILKSVSMQFRDILEGAFAFANDNQQITILKLMHSTDIIIEDIENFIDSNFNDLEVYNLLLYNAKKALYALERNIKNIKVN